MKNPVSIRILRARFAVLQEKHAALLNAHQQLKHQRRKDAEDKLLLTAALRELRDQLNQALPE
jgi:hypothetical protein